jgi:hypothetical protein
LGLAWLGLGGAEQARRPKTDGYTAAAGYLKANARPGDEILMGDKVEFWTLMWRLAGSDWGDPLHTYVASDSWARLTRKAPAALQARLSPDRLCILVAGVQAVLADPARPCPPVSGQAFTLGIAGEDTPAPKGRTVVQRLQFEPLILLRWSRPSAAAAP